LPPVCKNTVLTVDMITRESLRILKNNLMFIDHEVVRVMGVVGNTVTIKRGYGLGIPI
jgi:hypothetical protein